MGRKGMGKHMRALNKAFERAFEHSNEKDNIAELLGCMGEELGCDRISIFEVDEEKTCSNTYEWCSEGTVREQILLQHLPLSAFDTWYERLVHHETITILDKEEIRTTDPDVYQMFADEDIRSAIVSLLAFRGKTIGFFILENPDKETLEDRELIIPGIRYILSSLVYSDHLVHRLKRIGYTDSLTGVGNRYSLHEYLTELDAEKSISVLYCDVVGWDETEGKQLQMEGEQTLLRMAEILTNVFDEEHVFRVASGEFLVVTDGESQEDFHNDLLVVQGLAQEHNLLAALACTWKESIDISIDTLIHEVHQAVIQERKLVVQHRGSRKPAQVLEAEHEDLAAITLTRGNAFFRKADTFLAELFEESVVTVAVDINYFKLYNDIFGRKAGNIFLENIAELIEKKAEEHNGICGYIGGDEFCMILPTEKRDYKEIIPYVEAMYSALEFPDGFAPAMGIYFSTDRRETVTSMYDKALSALGEIKGDYIKRYRFYSAENHRHQKEDKMLVLDVKEGLPKGEFIFYVQPQVQEKTGKIIGGEALVRWLHNGKLISPGRFIPILEKTGYVFAVDCCVWESVAKWLRDLQRRGIQPVPVSVNVSRVDFYFTDIAEHFINLVRQYDIDPSLMGIEITESAFTDNTDSILDAIKRLHDAGFHILMDDFGSGSSSLSMLHTMNLDVLKTDVQFMSKNNQDNRAISIVESVISMAHMIGMTVVTEGVETEDQKENLISLGGNFAQGYYFYRPMPVEEFEKLIADEDKVARVSKRTNVKTASHLRFREMIRDGLVSETLLENIIRAAAIYKEENGQIAIVQMNNQYSSLTGLSQDEEDMEHFTDHLEEGDMQALKQILAKANTHPLEGSEGAISFRRSDGTLVEMKMRIFLLYSFDSHRLYLSSMG